VPDVPKPASDQEKLQGVWQAVELELVTSKDEAKQAQLIQRCRWHFTKEKITFQLDDDKSLEGTFSLDPSQKPKQLDFTLSAGMEKWLGQKFTAVYKLEGDTLTVCTALPKAKRPAGFALLPGIAGDLPQDLAARGMFGLSKFKRQPVE